tara:strand:+ start:299 stop:463 length:165 start_codon:yes stop_codon:yes gene_type:complete
LRFSQVHHRQAAAAGQNVSGTFGVFVVDGVIDLCDADGNRRAERFPAVGIGLQH